jgi:SAM-dependent methyltransferase
MKHAIRRLVRPLFFTSNTIRYRVELPRLREALSRIGMVELAVDVGSAGGYYVTNAYAKYANRLLAIEPDPQLCRLLASEIAPLGKRASWRQGSILQLPLDSNLADVVTSTQVLEHVEDDLRAMSELARVVKPNGYVLITVPQPPAPWPEGGHVREGYRINDLVRLAEPQGLELLDHDYFLTLPTQRLCLLAHRFHERLPAIWPVREIMQSREERANEQPYGLLALFRKFA